MLNAQWCSDPVAVQLQDLRRQYRHLRAENDELRDRVHVTTDRLYAAEYTLLVSWCLFAASGLLYFLL